MHRKSFLIFGVSSVFVAVLCLSLYYLYHAPIIGITTAWNAEGKEWKVTASKPWSPLKPGDVIQGIGDLKVGFHELLLDNIYLSDRAELFSWLEAKKKVYDKLAELQPNFLIRRDGVVMSIPVKARKAGLSFLGRLEFLHVIEGILFFLIGVAVLHRSGIREQSLAFFFMCVAISGVFLTNGTSLANEIVYEPSYLYGMNIANQILFFLASPISFYFALLMPRKRRFLERFPRLFWIFLGINLVIGVMLFINLNNFLLAFYYLLAIASVVYAFWAYRDPLERQQMKWVAAGFIFGFGPWVAINGIPILLTGKGLIADTIPALFVVLVPLFIAFAIQKYRLLDIDVLFEGSFVYLATILVLSVIEVGLMGFFGSKWSDAFEMTSSFQVFLSLILVLSIYAPLRNRVQCFVRRLFRKETLNEGELLRTFTSRASGKTADEVLEIFLSVIREIFHPEKAFILARNNPGAEEVLAWLRGEKGPVALWEKTVTVSPTLQDIYLALPLGEKDEPDRSVFLGRPSHRPFYSRRDMNLLQLLQTQAELLFENARLFEVNLEQQRKRVEEERRYNLEKEKIFKDLHDGLGGITTNIHLLAEMARTSPSIPDVRRTLATISELSREGLSEIRGVIQSLDVKEISWDALVSEFRHFGSKMLDEHQISLEMETSVEDDVEKPDSLLCLHLFKIFREALTNVIKHAGAKRVAIALAVDKKKLTLSIKDDGKGVDRPKNAGRGLTNMKARAAELGGNLFVVSHSGTEVRLEIPLPIKYPATGIEAPLEKK